MQPRKPQHSQHILLIISIMLAFALSTSCTIYIADPDVLSQGSFLNNTIILILLSTLAFITVTSIVVIHLIKRLNNKLQHSNSRYQQMIESNQDLVWETDKEGRFRYVSPTVHNLLGYMPEEFLGHSHTKFMTRLDSETFQQTFNDFLSERKPFQLLHKTFLHKNGKKITLQSSGTPIFTENGEFNGYHGFDRDISVQERDKEFIEHLAYHDQLTGLPNRKMIEKSLIQELSRSQRHKRFGALFFIDLDNFKRINDSLGHHVGDQLLQKVSTRISKYIREEDSIGRLGGDEFILLIPELSDDEAVAREHATETAYKVLSLLSIPINVDQHILNIGGSIGIALFPGDGDEPDEVMRHADTAMYLAKNSGKNTFKFYQHYLQKQMERRISIEEKLHHSFEDNQLELYYQPQSDLNTGKITAIEALLRWNHPEEGLLTPDQFIPVAEECGLILKLGEWVLEEACRQNNSWIQQGLCHVPVSINLSAIQFRQSNLMQSLINVLSKTQMPAELLEIELKESALMQDYNLAMDFLQLIKASGGSVAIDDFGTGYSNLSILKKMPVNKLKIDRSFVNDLENDENDQIICRTIINMARSMNLETTAEGVETPEQMKFLKDNGCTNMQGYLLSKPLPAGEFETFIKNYQEQAIPVH